MPATAQNGFGYANRFLPETRVRVDAATGANPKHFQLPNPDILVVGVPAWRT